MQTKNNSVHITGGGSGIGLALARVLIEAGNEVVICGRDEKKLRAAQQTIPGLKALPCVPPVVDASMTRDSRVPKMALFGLIWALEMAPMVTFIRWRVQIRKGSEPQADAATLTRFRLMNDAETALIVLIVLCATLMSRGFGS